MKKWSPRDTVAMSFAYDMQSSTHSGGWSLLAQGQGKGCGNTQIPFTAAAAAAANCILLCSETKGHDHGDGFYAGMPVPCTDSYATHCVHGKCEIKHNTATCRCVSCQSRANTVNTDANAVLFPRWQTLNDFDSVHVCVVL